MLKTQTLLDPTALDRRPDYPLAAFAGAPPPAPDWYGALMRQPPEEHRVTVEGAGIEVLAWGERGRPGILLVHGNWAHARWWGPVAPLLAKDYRVAALSLSGMGGSDWRDHYAHATRNAELAAAIEIAGLRDGGRAPIVVGHSLGGAIVASAMAALGQGWGGAVVLDSFIVPPELQPGGRPMTIGVRHYPDIASALARFRLSPAQPTSAPYILDDVARAGLVEAQGVWRWRFDPTAMGRTKIGDAWSGVTTPSCPLAFCYGENSALATPAIVAVQRAGAPPGTPSIGIPQAWHHLMFDQPFALVATLRALAACWWAG